VGGNIAYGMGQLGANPILVGAVGDDFLAEYKPWLERNGVDSGIWAHDSSLGTLELIEYELGSQIEGYIEDPVNGRTPLPAIGTDDSASLENVEYICGSEDLLITLELGTVFFTPLP